MLSDSLPSSENATGATLHNTVDISPKLSGTSERVSSGLRQRRNKSAGGLSRDEC